MSSPNMSSPKPHEVVAQVVVKVEGAVQNLKYFSDTFDQLYAAEEENFNKNCERLRLLEQKKLFLDGHVNATQKVISTCINTQIKQDALWAKLNDEISECQERMLKNRATLNFDEKKMMDLSQQFDPKILQEKIAESQRSKEVLKNTIASNLKVLKVKEDELTQQLNYTKFENLQAVTNSLTIDEAELKIREAKSAEMSMLIEQLKSKLENNDTYTNTN